MTQSAITETARPAPPISRWAVWTDFGGVVTRPVNETFESFSHRYSVPIHALKEAMATVGRSYGTDSMGALDIPLVDEPTWSSQVEAELEESYGLQCDLSNFGDRWFDGRPSNQRWIDYLHSLRERGVFVGMLSNLPPAWETHWRRMVAESLFDSVVCSHAVGSRKPSAEIFAVASERSGRADINNILIDDLPVNCAGAELAGWQSVAFTNADQAIAAVERLLSVH